MTNREQKSCDIINNRKQVFAFLCRVVFRKLWNGEIMENFKPRTQLKKGPIFNAVKFQFVPAISKRYQAIGIRAKVRTGDVENLWVVRRCIEEKLYRTECVVMYISCITGLKVASK